MASTIKKTANALSSESDLLNVYADLKAVCQKFESYLSVSESAQKRVLNWAEKRVRVPLPFPLQGPPRNNIHSRAQQYQQREGTMHRDWHAHPMGVVQ
jgi:hypothetical protein